MIEARKFDGRPPHYSWGGYVLKQTKDYLIVANIPGRTLHHHRRATVYTYDNYSLEFYPFEADFTVGLDIERTGEMSYYCNICLPSVLQDETLSFIDLDLDLVYRNGVWQVVDEDEFMENQRLYHYPVELIERTRASFDQQVSTEQSLRALRDDQSAATNVSVIVQPDPSRSVGRSSHPVIGSVSPEMHRQQITVRRTVTSRTWSRVRTGTTRLHPNTHD